MARQKANTHHGIESLAGRPGILVMTATLHE
jgi:hypothetical protein